MMGQIIKQPNGLFAEFSSVCGEFTYVNLTSEQLIEAARKEAADEAEQKYRRAIERAEKGEKPVGGHTWKQAVNQHNRGCDKNERITP